MSVADEQTRRLPIAGVSEYVADILGPAVAAVVAGTGDALAPARWATDQEIPGPEAQRCLRDAFQIVELLLRYESGGTVRSWFVGANPELDDRSPAVMIRHDPEAVSAAANYFVAHG